MDTYKHNCSVTLLCPTCGGGQFEFAGSGESIGSAKCASCGREFTKDALINENSENISEHVKEMGRETTKDLAKETRDALIRSFRDSKKIKLS